MALPASPLYLGLDFGTGGARACLIDAHGAVVWQGRTDYLRAEEQTPADWLAALRRVLEMLPAPLRGRIASLAVDGTSATVLLADAVSRPLGPALLYKDDRAAANLAQLEAAFRTAHPAAALPHYLSATSGLAKFHWLMRQPKAAGAARFCHQADWITARLSGRAGLSDYHNALKTGYDARAQSWPEWIMRLPYAALLPTAVMPGMDLGTVSADAARRFDLPPACRVRAGTTDSIAAFLAAGAREPGEGVTSLGSTLVLKLLSRRRVEAVEYGVYSHWFGPLWLAGGASNAGGGVLRQFFTDAQLQALSRRVDPDAPSGLDYYPLPAPGERFPVNDPAHLPRLTPRPPDDALFLQGLLEGLARIEAAGYARLTLLGATPPERILSAGGGAANETYNRIRARLLKVPVAPALHAEASYGSALLARDGSGIFVSAATGKPR